MTTREIVTALTVAAGLGFSAGGVALADPPDAPSAHRAPAPRGQLKKTRASSDVPVDRRPAERCADGQNCEPRRTTQSWSDDSTGSSTEVENPQGQEPVPSQDNR